MGYRPWERQLGREITEERFLEGDNVTDIPGDRPWQIPYSREIILGERPWEWYHGSGTMVEVPWENCGLLQALVKFVRDRMSEDNTS